MIIVAILIVSVIAVTIALFITRKMTQPIKSLTDAAAKIADGQFDVTVERTSKDDIGDLAENFGKTTDRLRNYSDYITEISSVLNQIADGNLDIALTMDYKGQFAKLKAAPSLISISQQIRSLPALIRYPSAHSRWRQVPPNRQALSRSFPQPSPTFPSR
mgnify:CR=1 FL=1